MRIGCPNCGQTLSGPEGILGRKVRCKACSREFIAAAGHVVSETSPAPSLCPRCRAPLEAESVVCIGCGLNLRTGVTALAGGTPEAVAEDEPEPLPFLYRVIEFVGELLPGIFRPAMLVAAIFTMLVGLGVAGVAMFMLALGVLFTGMFLGACALIVYAQALAFLLQGEWGFLHELLAELDSRRWWLFFALMAMPFVLLYLGVRPFLPTGH